MLIPEKRKQILEVFFKEPFREAHLREIARLSKVSVTNVNNSMRIFLNAGMFHKREISNMVFYKSNLENPELLKLFEYLEIEKRKEFYIKNKRIARLLQKYTTDIVSLSDNMIQSVILFGSVARGEWTRGSDIDILTIVSGKEKETDLILNKAKADISALPEISPINTTAKNFKEAIKNQTEFYLEVWRDRVVLYNEFLFWQLIKQGGG